MMEKNLSKMLNNKFWMIKPQFSNEDIKAVFSLRSFKTDGKIERKAFAKKVGFNSQNLIVPNQTHSTNVNFVSTAKLIKSCDGIFTNEKNIACSIQVADCMPIFVAHLSKNVFGLVHAGWRGLVNGILENSARLIIEKGYRLSDFEIIIGPSIQKCCFEVRDDIVQKFKSEFVIQTDENGKYKVDLQKYALSELMDSGFEKSKIKFISECTYCLKEKYHSYRRDGKNSGRMIGLIGSS